MVKSQGTAEECFFVVVYTAFSRVGAGDWFGVAYRTLGVSVEVEATGSSRWMRNSLVTVVELADFGVEFSWHLVVGSTLTSLKTRLKHWAAGYVAKAR